MELVPDPADEPEVAAAFDVEELVEAEVVEVEADEPDLVRTLGETYEELLAAAEQVLDEVDGALVRLRTGTYGTCEVCGDGIADDRLAEVPTARTCERHLPLARAG